MTYVSVMKSYYSFMITKFVTIFHKRNTHKWVYLKWRRKLVVIVNKGIRINKPNLKPI